MARQKSAGILLYRRRQGSIEVYLAHPGGPYFRKKHEGYWGIPKGLVAPEEREADAAAREFAEETGFNPPEPEHDLGSCRLKSGKEVHAYAAEWPEPDDPPALRSNTFELEWPPKSGERQEFPEIDRVSFFPIDRARDLINAEQSVFLDRLEERFRATG
jgi:predicted NUDIX family NTP pyrophosphohydrolase